MRSNIIQIAGVKNEQEVNLLLKYGVDFIGYPLRLPVNAEDISEKRAREIIKNTNSQNQSVLITYLDKAFEISELCHFLQVNFVQLHGNISITQIEKLKNSNPHLKIIKSLVIGRDDFKTIEKTIHYTFPLVEYYITDTYNPETGASGATGLTHDWEMSKTIVELSPVPVILAGGLTPANVSTAIQQVMPAGVDVHTGVEMANGNKSEIKVKYFINKSRQAFQHLKPMQNKTLPIEDTLDLHRFHPKDVKSLVNEYLYQCHKAGILECRIIHGKGRGVLKKIVHSQLSNHPNVLEYRLANDRFSSWGATIVLLKN